jgi:hypothetical protein
VISNYSYAFLNSRSTDLHYVLNSFEDECLRRIAADSNVSWMVMNTALDILRARKDVELGMYEWECSNRRVQKFHALPIVHAAQLAEAEPRL